MNKKNRKVAIIILLVLIVLALISIFIIKKRNSEETVPPKQVEVIDNVSNYDYNLEDRDTELYKENFAKLKEILNNSEIDYEEYCEYIAKLFVIDLYTIDNKISKYDVGGVDFIYPSYQEKFKNKVMDTLYKLVIDDSTNTRKQELPVVSDVIVTETKKATYTLEGKNMPSYEITLTLTYEKDLGYDKNLKVTLVIIDEHAYVVNTTAI